MEFNSERCSNEYIKYYIDFRLKVGYDAIWIFMIFPKFVVQMLMCILYSHCEQLSLFSKSPVCLNLNVKYNMPFLKHLATGCFLDYPVMPG